VSLFKALPAVQNDDDDNSNDDKHHHHHHPGYGTSNFRTVCGAGQLFDVYTVRYTVT
jgi:hypothetical protein